MSQIPLQNVPATPLPTLQPAHLPVAQLESLRSKINSIVESIQMLQATIDQQGQNVMPSWPDILSKYTILLSQSHNLSMSLVGTAAAAKQPVNGHGGTPAQTNPYERLALHPSVPMTDHQLDNELIPLLRSQQTTDVLKLENDTVRHLAEHMSTRGSLGVLGLANTTTNANSQLPTRPRFGMQDKKPEYADVLRECEQIKLEHDERVDRAVRAVMLLREKFDWKARVEVESGEPEELDWGPVAGGEGLVDEDVEMNVDGGAQTGDEGREDESNESEEEEELEEVLRTGVDNSSPPDTPPPGQTAET